MRMRWLTVLTAVCAAMVSAQGLACPFCPIPDAPLGQQVASSDAALLVRWTSSSPADGQNGARGVTAYEVVRVLRQPKDQWQSDSRLQLDGERAGRAGDLYLLLGAGEAEMQWKNPIRMTESCFAYVAQAPGRDAPSAVRLTYYLRFLENPDELIANDAFAEFASSPYREIEPLAGQFSAAELRRWIACRATNQSRLGFYGMMLGLCGAPADAAFLKTEIERPTEGFRLGLDGMMAGYVLLVGNDGLALLESTFTAGSSTGQLTSTYAAVQTLRFLWEYARNRFDENRVRGAMRLLLYSPEFAEMAIKDLARWEDWEVMPRLMELYDSPSFGTRPIRRAVVQYLIMLRRKTSGSTSETQVQLGQAATRHLETLRNRDPGLVKDAEKYVF